MEQIRGVLRLYYNDDKSNCEMSLTAKRVQVRNSTPEPPRISQKENCHEYFQVSQANSIVAGGSNSGIFGCGSRMQ